MDLYDKSFLKLKELTSLNFVDEQFFDWEAHMNTLTNTQLLMIISESLKDKNV
jgi:hypothetical protein